MEISVIDSSSPDIDSFIQQTESAKLCHLPSWTCMVEKAFGHKGNSLVAREDGRICGVLPLTHVRSRLFGYRLVSQPFSDYGGPLATSAAVLKSLYNRAVEIAAECGCESLELRNTVPLPYELHMRTDKIAMRLHLAEDPQEVRKGLRHKTRNRICKAESAGLTVTSDGPLVEIPVSTVNVLGCRVCFFGGGYLRISPLPVIRWGARRLQKERRPLIIYVHPREIDPGHPRLPLGRWRSFKCYNNLQTTLPKLTWLCEHHSFGTMAELVSQLSPDSQTRNVAFGVPRTSGRMAPEDGVMLGQPERVCSDL